MNEIQEAIEKIQETESTTLKGLLACKDAVHVASEANPDSGLLKALHHRLWEAEVAVLQAHDLVLSQTEPQAELSQT